MIVNHHRLSKLILCAAILLMTACTPSSDTTSTSDSVVVAVKQLATVEIPPTPDQAEREATRRALPTTPTAPPATATYTPTPYIGVFLGTPPGDNEAVAEFSIPTAQGQGVVDNCAIPFDVAFGTSWRSNPSVMRRIGCPIQQRFGFAGSVQVFERGVMYRRIDTNEVWAVLPGNIGTGKYWYVSQPLLISAAGLTAPEGLRVPADTFGSVWLSNGEISESLGYATTPEQTADLNIQRFDGGTLFLDVTVGQVFLLFDNSDAFGPY